MKIEIRMDKQRMLDLVTVDELVGLQGGDFKAIRDVLSRFVIGEDGNYLPEEEGLKIVGKLTIGKLMDLGKGFLGRAEDLAVPPTSGGG
jgi:hypothetical protein